MQAGIPSLSESVEPRISRFGEAVTREGGPLRRAADPFNVSSVVEDPVADEPSSQPARGDCWTVQHLPACRCCRGEGVRPLGQAAGAIVGQFADVFEDALAHGRSVDEVARHGHVRDGRATGGPSEGPP